jgi:hypothetical protein
MKRKKVGMMEKMVVVWVPNYKEPQQTIVAIGRGSVELGQAESQLLMIEVQHLVEDLR